jgi:hypothetical protein
MTTDTTAAAETLTAEVRVLMVGNRQVTMSVARQLDRLDLFGYGPGAITPFGRVKTGMKVEQERVKEGYRRYSKQMLDSNKYFETYMAEPVVEVIGRANIDDADSGQLVIFVVGPRDVDDVCTSDESRAELRAVIRKWEELPLIVLGGLR